MKIVKQGVAVVVAVLPFALAFALSAQTSELQQVPPDSIPEWGTFWSLQITNSVPLPFDNFPDLPLYELDPTNHIYLIDDRSVDYDALEQEAEVQAATVAAARLPGFDQMDEESGFSSQDYGFSSDDLLIYLGKGGREKVWTQITHTLLIRLAPIIAPPIVRVQRL